MPKTHSVPNVARRVLALAAVFASSVASAASRAGELSICVDRASPAAAADARLADELARAAGATPKLHRYDGRGRGDDDFSLHDFKKLLGGDCRFVVGFPYDAAAGPLPRYLKATAPYARTGFVLVTRGDSPYATLASMPQGTRVGVAYDTLPNHYFRHHPGLVRDIFEDENDSLAAVAGGEVAGAMLWRAAVAKRLERTGDRDAFRLQPIDEEGSQWNLVALYGSDDDGAAAIFDAAIARLRADGRLARTLGAYAEAVGAADAAPATAFAGNRASVRSHLRSSRSCAAPKKTAKVPALFTQAQAGEGKAVYEAKCSFCHAPDLTGRAGPALKGKFFASPTHKYKVGDIFTIVAQNMPATAPGSLAPEEYVKIMAFILQQNGYPAGEQELTFDAAKDSKTPLRYYGE
jgi:mono/diheme cytochrome c family protein